MKYKQARELAIVPFIILFNSVNISFNQILTLSMTDIISHLILASFLGLFVGILFWVSISSHYLRSQLENLDLTKEDILFIQNYVEKYKISKNMTYKEFNQIVNETKEFCTSRVICEKDDLESFIIASVCLQCRILRYGSWRRGVREIRYLENENFDAVQIIDYVITGN